MLPIPIVVDTPRLHLRQSRASDAPAMFVYANDPDVAYYADWPRCTTLDAVSALIEAHGPAWSSGEEYFWVVTLLGTDTAIGSASLRIVEHAADFGYILGRAHWGKGLGTELSRAIVSLALGIPSVRRVWATTDAENAASARVLEKSGLVREGVLRSYRVRPQISPEPRDALIYAMVR